MIVRIVKMVFVKDKIDEFLNNFEANKHHILDFEGCNHLQLLRDIHQSHQFFTYSFWDSEAHLNTYRSSALFKGIWKQTKPLFSKPAEAWSLDQLHTASQQNH